MIKVNKHIFKLSMRPPEKDEKPRQVCLRLLHRECSDPLLLRLKWNAFVGNFNLNDKIEGKFFGGLLNYQLPTACTGLT